VEANEGLISNMERAFAEEDAARPADARKVNVDMSKVKAERIKFQASIKFISEFAGVRNSELVDSADILRDTISGQLFDVKRKLELVKMDPEDESSESLLEFLLRSEEEIHQNQERVRLIRAERVCRKEIQEVMSRVEVDQQRCERNTANLELLNAPHFFAGVRGNPDLLLEKLQALYALPTTNGKKASVAFELRLKAKIIDASAEELAEFASALKEVKPQTDEHFNITGIAQDALEAFCQFRGINLNEEAEEVAQKAKGGISINAPGMSRGRSFG
jgi:translation initiation factor 2 beta subunit (eIF-2beta)/eIF-5